MRPYQLNKPGNHGCRINKVQIFKSAPDLDGYGQEVWSKGTQKAMHVGFKPCRCLKD
jgi:hypothetical protein